MVVLASACVDDVLAEDVEADDEDDSDEDLATSLELVDRSLTDVDDCDVVSPAVEELLGELCVVDEVERFAVVVDGSACVDDVLCDEDDSDEDELGDEDRATSLELVDRSLTEVDDCDVDSPAVELLLAELSVVEDVERFAVVVVAAACVELLLCDVEDEDLPCRLDELLTLVVVAVDCDVVSAAVDEDESVEDGDEDSDELEDAELLAELAEDHDELECVRLLRDSVMLDVDSPTLLEELELFRLGGAGTITMCHVPARYRSFLTTICPDHRVT